jgi:hypothetical protein
MMQKLLLTLLLSASLLIATTASAPPSWGATREARHRATVWTSEILRTAAEWTNNEISLHFPEAATFRASFSSVADITSIALEYGNEQQTCGEVIAKAFPEFTPGKTVHVEWTWEMRQSGSLPPGARLWWRWRMTDANGQETVTDVKTATWLDDVHNWQTMNNGDHLRLHWYEGNQAFAADLAQAAADGLVFNETQSGLKAEEPIDLYIYASTDDLKEAILYEPSWTGGQAFPDQNIVILGISPADLVWGRDAIVHELTHVLVGHLTFSCLGDVPTWLNEGLAVYSEGELDPASERQLEDAIRDDSLLTVRSLSSGFSEVADKAYLSYSQSYSLTKFLIETYGQEKMTSLLLSLQGGVSIDEALIQTYGFNVDGLDAAWREAIGAQPSPISAQPTTQPTPTFVPTIVPMGGVAVLAQVTPTPVPTSSFNGQPTGVPVRTGPPLELTMILLGMCCAFLVLIGVVILGFVVRRQNRAGGEDVR